MTPYTMSLAEADLRTAIDAGDHAAIARLEKIIDTLDTHPTVSLHSAALWYAEQGHPVFPLQPGTKIPFPRTRGCKDATTDPTRIRDWWTTHPDANIGLATGHTVDVVDIDGHDGHTSRLGHWDDLFDRIEADVIGKVDTPRAGGMHLYVPATGDGNKAGIFPGIDYRGHGGYVVAPPSRTQAGAYIWLGTPALTTTRAA